MLYIQLLTCLTWVLNPWHLSMVSQKYSKHSHSLLLLLTMGKVAADTKFIDSYGTIMSYEGPIFVNPKPFIAIQKIDLDIYYKNDEAFRNLTRQFSDRMKDIDYKMAPYLAPPKQQSVLKIKPESLYYLDQWNGKLFYTQATTEENTELRTQLETQLIYKVKQIQPLAYTGSEQYNLVFSRLKEFVNQNIPNVPLQTKNDTLSRDKRFLLPVLTAILPIAKTLAFPALAKIAKTTVAIVSEAGHRKLEERLMKDRTKVMQLPDINVTNFNSDDFSSQYPGNCTTMQCLSNIDGLAFRHQLPTMQMAQTFKIATVTDIVTTEANQLSAKRQALTLEYDNLLTALQLLVEGTVTEDILPLSNMQTMVDTILMKVDHSESEYRLPVSAQQLYQLYKLITPFAIRQENTLIIFLIFPLLHSQSSMEAYSVQTLPFLTKEGIPLQLQIPNRHFATSTKIYLSIDDYMWNSCDLIAGQRFCRTASPLKEARNECLYALFLSDKNRQNIEKLCQFTRAQSDQAVFQALGPNYYAYYLPISVNGQVHCRKVGEDETTVLYLNRTGTFQYPPFCSASIMDYTFHDTAAQTMDNESFMPNLPITFGTFLQEAADNHVVDRTLTDLIISQNVNSTKPDTLIHLIDETRINNLHDEQQTFSSFIRSIPDQIWNLFATVVTFLGHICDNAVSILLQMLSQEEAKTSKTRARKG